MRAHWFEVSAALAVQTQYNVVNILLNDLIWHFLNFIVKEQLPGDFYLFLTILEVQRKPFTL